MPFNYQKFVKHLTAIGKRREAWFILKHYIEGKTRKQIIEEMYINSNWYYYNLKKRCKDLVGKNYNIHKFLDKN